ncbi:toxin-antitoxin system YwqK family antitoxin [Labilibacter marinus]|uniref:toxin-antitoxin system YwqK family antitoxin n=1 Tax=Labilibacter marinus TaxID=1477105 RepID=UPI000837354D|nr:toxin-antitoxin system YwqK family antitoxin [Labilibacter marinus]
MKKTTQHIFPLLICIAFIGYFLALPIHAQNDTNNINLEDNSGLKQGLWIVKKDGRILEKGKYKNNRKEGVWLNYFENGNIKTEITFINGEAKGHAKFFYENGKLREEGNWQVDHWEGSYKYFFESGKISYDWFYNSNGKRQGEQRYFYENGEKMYEGQWENGKTEGVLKVYNDQGMLVQEKLFNNGKFEQAKTPVKQDSSSAKFSGTGFHTIMNLRGDIDEKGFFVKGDLLNGERYNYDENNKLISITTLQDGKAIGTKRAQ